MEGTGKVHLSGQIEAIKWAAFEKKHTTIEGISSIDFYHVMGVLVPTTISV